MWPCSLACCLVPIMPSGISTTNRFGLPSGIRHTASTCRHPPRGVWCHASAFKLISVLSSVSKSPSFPSQFLSHVPFDLSFLISCTFQCLPHTAVSITFPSYPSPIVNLAAPQPCASLPVVSLYAFIIHSHVKAIPQYLTSWSYPHWSLPTSRVEGGF